MKCTNPQKSWSSCLSAACGCLLQGFLPVPQTHVEFNLIAGQDPKAYQFILFDV